VLLGYGAFSFVRTCASQTRVVLVRVGSFVTNSVTSFKTVRSDREFRRSRGAVDDRVRTQSPLRPLRWLANEDLTLTRTFNICLKSGIGGLQFFSSQTLALLFVFGNGDV
jgi:hypothetical protein